MPRKDRTRVAGRRIVAVRPMTGDELELEGWAAPILTTLPLALVLDDGTKIYASADEEGNAPGVLFGLDAKGKPFVLGL